MSSPHGDTLTHHLPPEQVASQQRRAVLFFILADAVFYGCLLFTYFYLRALNVDGGWLPDGAKTASSWVVWTIAAITVVSALVYRAGEVALRAGQRSRFTGTTLIALVLVVAALALMVYQVLTWPILMSDGSYASSFIVMAWVQFVHLIVLLIVGVGIWNRAIQGKLDDGNDTHAVLVGYFWYWVTLTACLGALTTLFV